MKPSREMGLRIKYVRKKCGYNQEKLAEELGMTTSAIGGYETGKSFPSVEVLTRLSEILNVSIDWLIRGEGESDYQLETISSKPADQGSFGSQVENFLRQQLAEKDQQIKSLLKIIERGNLGKDEVTELTTGWLFEGDASSRVTCSVTGLPKLAA